MRFKVGDKVRVLDDPSGEWRVIEEERKAYGVAMYWAGGDWYEEDDLEPVTDPLADKIEERNNKPYTPPNTGDPWIDNLPEEYFEMYEEEDTVNRPSHYNNGDKDLFDEWHERYYHSEKTYTGREVFIEIMKSVAERYARRYPNKNPEDIDKAIYTLNRLKEYEELEEEE